METRTFSIFGLLIPLGRQEDHAIERSRGKIEAARLGIGILAGISNSMDLAGGGARNLARQEAEGINAPGP